MNYRILFSFLILFLLPSCSKGNVTSETLFVKKIENLNSDFIFCMDTSSIISLENSNVHFYNFDSKEQDVFKTLNTAGFTHIRTRIWNDPFTKDGRGYGGGNCDINNALKIARRAKQNNMKMFLDFHYSDFWADPQKQMVPKAWKNFSLIEKGNALYSFTKECLNKMKQENIEVSIVSIGNEVNNYFLEETNWENICYLLNKGSEATKEIYPNSKVMIHFTNPETPLRYETYANELQKYNVNYDVFGSSYYPFWHGSISNLNNVLNIVSSTYGKETFIAETSYPYTNLDTDFHENTIPSNYMISLPYPVSVQGQANYLRDLIDSINKNKKCLGLSYWEGAWISIGQESKEINKQKWEELGSGWASSFAGEYDTNDAGKYYGGCAVENQALFDEDGYPIESLKVFKLIKEGNAVPIKLDSIKDTYLEFNVGSEIILPTKVFAINNDNTENEIEVHWNEEDILGINNQKKGSYFVNGKANNYDAFLNVIIK